MDQVVRALDVRNVGAVSAVRELLWRLMDHGIVDGLLVPLQTSTRELPAPTLIKNRERLDKANPLAPVMSLNSAKIAGMLLEQESDKRLGVVLRPCEARALTVLGKHGALSLDRLVTISIDCLGSHDAADYEQRMGVWGNETPVAESLRWSRLGQVASYRFRRACQVCTLPYFDGADVSIGLFGQRLSESILIFADSELASEIGLGAGRVGSLADSPAAERHLVMRRDTVERLVARRYAARARAFSELGGQAPVAGDLAVLFDDCSLCGACQEVCPLTDTIVSRFNVHEYSEITPEYTHDRLLEIAARSEVCSGCGMCETACECGIPLMLIAQLFAHHPELRTDLLNDAVQSDAP